jgi:glycosyltransferase involved in cell wall biosynthesis
LRILVFHNIKKSFGGGGYSVYKFLEALSKKGHQIHILYVNNSEFAKKEGNFYTYSKWGFNSNKNGLWLINRTIEKVYDLIYLKRLLKKNKFDYVIGFQRRAAVKAFKYGKKNKIKIVNFIFETPEWLKKQWSEWRETWDKNAKLRTSWFKFKTALLNSDIVIANSKLTAHEYQKWTGQEVSGIVYPGIDYSINTKNNITQKEDQIIYLGRLEENKNVDDLIKAFEQLKSTTKLVICGDGSNLKALQNLAKSVDANIEFRGKVSEDEKWFELRKSKLLIFPSSFEGFGMPPMEALSVGTPCICSDIPILKEVYKDNVDYFQLHDVDELLMKMEWYLSNQKKSEEIGEKGKKFVLNKFGWKQSSRQLESILMSEIQGV